jgi:hypothetical protein
MLDKIANQYEIPPSLSLSFSLSRPDRDTTKKSAQRESSGVWQFGSESNRTANAAFLLSAPD